MRRLDIAGIIRDLGGPTEVSRRTGVLRKDIYKHLQNRSMKIIMLEKIMTEFPELRLDGYIYEEHDENGADFGNQLEGRATARRSLRRCVRISG